MEEATSASSVHHQCERREDRESERRHDDDVRARREMAVAETRDAVGIDQRPRARVERAAPAPASGFGVAGGIGEGSAGGALGGVFGGMGNAPAPPAVKAPTPKKIAISSGVAQGNLLNKTMPVYPAIAKAARIQGTVVLAATISKTGTIEGLHVISGPQMLQQAAIDAVRTWRYRPYLLNGEPVEVETQVNVIFNLGG